jgi:hypothetical protein
VPEPASGIELAASRCKAILVMRPEPRVLDEDAFAHPAGVHQRGSALEGDDGGEQPTTDWKIEDG